MLVEKNFVLGNGWRKKVSFGTIKKSGFLVILTWKHKLETLN